MYNFNKMTLEDSGINFEEKYFPNILLNILRKRMTRQRSKCERVQRRR